MSTLKFREKAIFESLLNRGGHVLDFTNRTFSAFFNDFNLNIYDEKYSINGTSKMNRLRAFWELESDAMVAKVLGELIEYASAFEEISSTDRDAALKIISRLQGKISESATTGLSERDFLEHDFGNIDLTVKVST